MGLERCTDGLRTRPYQHEAPASEFRRKSATYSLALRAWIGHSAVTVCAIQALSALCRPTTLFLLVHPLKLGNSSLEFEFLYRLDGHRDVVEVDLAGR